MKRLILAAAAALLAAAPYAASIAAQSPQDQLDARYNRALAAGYKALFLCSAIANAERNGVLTSPTRLFEWGLDGIQSPFNAIVPELETRIYVDAANSTQAVATDWMDEAPPRVALYSLEQGCSLQPIGYTMSGAYSALPWPLVVNDDADRTPDGHEFSVNGTEELDGVVSQAFGSSPAYGAGARTTAILVTSDGRSKVEAYAETFNPYVAQRTWSVAKSIAATLIGAAVYRGEANVADSAGLGENESDPRRAITIDHGLRMATGRYSATPGNRTDALYFGGATVDEVATDWPLVHQPGTVFRYANNDTLIAVQAIEGTFTKHSPAALFEILGMDDTVAETDWQGNYILSSQVWSSARDLAKLGQLYLNDGKLPDGTRILPEGWVKYVTTPSGPQPPSGTFGYGAGFWLLNKEEGVPSDTFAAIGNRGQYLVVVPSRQIVIVRRGEDPVGSGFDIAAFTRDVLAALE